MRDKETVKKIKLLHPSIRVEVEHCIDLIEKEFPEYMAIRVVQGLRTIEEQNNLYSLGRTKPGNIVTNATGGKSFHNYGLAVDFAILIDKDRNGTYEALSWNDKEDYDKDGVIDWQEAVNVFKQAGYEWGGNWRTIVDNPHIQKSFGYTWKELFNKYNRKDFIPGTIYVSLK